VNAALDVRILSDEFNTLIKTVKYSSNTAGYSFINRVFFVSKCFILLDNVFKNDSNHCDNCDAEGSKGYSSAMIPHSPFN